MSKRLYIIIVSILLVVLLTLSLILYLFVFSEDNVKRKEFNENIDKIHLAASKIDKSEMKIGDVKWVSLTDLKEAGYDSLTNPYTKKEYPLDTKVLIIKKSDNKYIYRYEYEDNCKYNGNICLSDKISNDLKKKSINYNDGTYYKGNNDKITNNYLWFSGQEYRIMGINKDGSIKLVTSLPVVALSFGKTNDYNTSYVRKWLNDLDPNDSYDGVFYNNISRKDYLANYDFCIGGQDPTADADTTCSLKSSDKVGLLSWYEYKLLGNDSYLDINDRMLFSTKDNRNNNLLMTNYDGSLMLNETDYVSNPLSSNYTVSSVRAVINLGNSVSIFAGDGTKGNPYILTGETLTNGDSLSARTPGEYVNVGNYKYRIVDVDTNIKLVSDNRIKSTGTTKSNVYTYFDKGLDATNLCTNKWPYSNCSNKFNIADGISEYNGDNGHNIGYFLNNDFYKSLASYKDSLVQDDYYLSKWNLSDDYKNIYNSEINGYEAIKAYVGMLNYGEYLAGNNIESSSNAYNYWLINPHSNGLDAIYVTVSGNITYKLPSYDSVGVRPTITLSPNIKIKSGNGTKTDPFIIF